MAKILARIDDELHARLKRCAAEQGRSLNDLVTEALRNELERAATTTRERVIARAAGLGMLARPSGWVPPDRIPTHEELARMTAGASDAILDGLEWARGPRP